MCEWMPVHTLRTMSMLLLHVCMQGFAAPAAAVLNDTRCLYVA